MRLCYGCGQPGHIVAVCPNMANNAPSFVGAAKVNAVIKDVMAAATAYYDGGINSLSADELHIQLGDEEGQCQYADVMHLAVSHASHWGDNGETTEWESSEQVQVVQVRTPVKRCKPLETKAGSPTPDKISINHSVLGLSPHKHTARHSKVRILAQQITDDCDNIDEIEVGAEAGDEYKDVAASDDMDASETVLRNYKLRYFEQSIVAATIQSRQKEDALKAERYLAELEHHELNEQAGQEVASRSQHKYRHAEHSASDNSRLFFVFELMIDREHKY